MIPNHLRTLLDTLEMQRITLRRRAARTVCIFLAIAIIAALGLQLADSRTAALVVLIVCALSIAISWTWHQRQLTRSFREQLMPELLHEISPSLEYQADESLCEDEFDDSSLWTSCDRYSGRDLFHGTVGDTDLRFSVVHAEEEYETTSTDSDGRKTRKTHYRTIFCGLLLSLDCNKTFYERTLVKPHRVGMLTRWGRSHVAMEDPQFNEHFTVTSSDQIEARYLLTPTMIQRLETLRAKLGDFCLAFSAGRLYLAVDRPYDLFDPDPAKPFNDPTQVLRMLNNIRSMTDVVNDLDMNTRTWSKPPRKMAIDASTASAR